MCRSSAAGGRRCSGGSAHRTRALNAARKQVERARRGLIEARATADPDAVQTAQTQLDQATQRLADTHTAHPRTSGAGQAEGHDTTTPETAEDPMNQHHGTTSDDNAHDTRDDSPHGEQTTAGQDGDTTSGGPHISHHQLPGGITLANVNYAAPGATVGEQTAVNYGNTTFTSTPRRRSAAEQATDQAAHAARRAARGQQATQSGTTTSNTADGDEDVNVQIGINLGNFYRHRSGQ